MRVLLVLIACALPAAACAAELRTGLAFSADGSGRAHSGTHPAARADALKRVPEWLKR